jgi:hypothetical protein
MTIPDDELPDRPLKRFFVALCAAAAVWLLIFLADGRRPTPESLGFAVVFSLATGVVSAIGKKALRLVLTFFSRII